MITKQKVKLTEETRKELMSDFDKAIAIFGEDFAVWLVVNMPKLFRDFSALVEMEEELNKTQTDEREY